MAVNRNNSGILNLNDRKEKSSHPDRKGKCTIDGKEYWISGWDKDGQYGPFISLAFDEVKPKADTNRAPDAPEGKEPF